MEKLYQMEKGMIQSDYTKVYAKPPTAIKVGDAEVKDDPVPEHLKDDELFKKFKQGLVDAKVDALRVRAER